MQNKNSNVQINSDKPEKEVVSLENEKLNEISNKHCVSHNKINAVVIPLLVASLCIASFLIPKKEFSERENRYLSEFPTLSWHTLSSGVFTEGIKDYLSDHFPFRDKWIEINTRKSLIQGKTLINGVFFAEDDYLIEQYESSSYLPKISKIVNKFVSKVSVPVYFMAVPTSVAINSDKLPEGAPNDDQLADIENELSNMDATLIQLFDYFETVNKATQLYYRLDHHWTIDGAFTAYTAFKYQKEKASNTDKSNAEYSTSLAENMSFLEYYNYLKDQTEYEKKISVVSDSFKGTLFNKVGECGLGADSIKTYDLSDISYTFTIDSSDTSNTLNTKESIYNDAALNTSDQYGYYLYGNNALSTIINNDNPEGATILIIKDSYANSLIPFLIQDYSCITIIDPRYYGDDISEYVNVNSIDEVLFVYNMNTLGTDLGIRTVK